MSWPDGVGREIHDEAGSTQDLARAAARAGVPGPVWFMARRQTAGRGRRGRVWTAPEGNLSATLLLRPRLSAAEAAKLSFVAALAVADAFAALAPGVEIGLKWPNDVLLEGGKAAGILLESEGSGGAADWVAVGIGLNLAGHPPADPDAAVPPTSLAALGHRPPAPEAALEALAVAFARHLAAFEAEGFAPIRARWLARAARLGGTMTARTAAETVTGAFADLDADGALVLHTPRGPRRITAAEVFFA